MFDSKILNITLTSISRKRADKKSSRFTSQMYAAIKIKLPQLISAYHNHVRNQSPRRPQKSILRVVQNGSSSRTSEVIPISSTKYGADLVRLCPLHVNYTPNYLTRL